MGGEPLGFLMLWVSVASTFSLETESLIGGSIDSTTRGMKHVPPPF